MPLASIEAFKKDVQKILAGRNDTVCVDFTIGNDAELYGRTQLSAMDGYTIMHAYTCFCGIQAEKSKHIKKISMACIPVVHAMWQRKSKRGSV